IRQRSQAPRLVHVHAAILGAPLVKRRVADVVLGANRLDRRVAFGFPEYPDDLFFAVLAFSHSSAAFLFAAELSFCHVQFFGVRSGATDPAAGAPNTDSA